MNNKILAASVAGGLLIAAGFVTTVISSPSVAVAEEGDDDSGETGIIPRTVSFLSEVLTDLVDDGTITQDQADAIVEAAEEKAAEMSSGMHPGPFFGRGPGFGKGFTRGLGFGALLDDGGIDQEEYDQLKEWLPEDHPLATADVSEYLEDGLITPDELRELFGDLMGSFRDQFRRRSGGTTESSATST